MISIGNLKIRPELKMKRYWLHIAIIAPVVQLILNWFGHDMGAIPSIHTLHIAIAVIAADIIAHTVLKLD